MDKKVIIIFAPHTSNWDFLLLLAARFSFRMETAFLGKHTVFKAPHGWFFKMLGGIPVERSSSKDMVNQVAKVIRDRTTIALGIAPEGTRKRTNSWKSGFYHVALQAQVPLVLAYLDKRTKEVGLGLRYELTGNVSKDMQIIKHFYHDKVGINPDLKSEIRLEARS